MPFAFLVSVHACFNYNDACKIQHMWMCDAELAVNTCILLIHI